MSVGSMHAICNGRAALAGRTFIREKVFDRSFPLLLLRQRISDRLANRNQDEKTLGIIEALALGITTHIDKSLWDLFRRTGTTHLMVISGAHIGLVSGLFYGLLKWLWRMGGPICLWIPATRVASMVALLMAVTYAVLAGFAVPAQRSLLAGFFILLRNFGRHRLSVWQSWRYALLAVLLIEPHAVLFPGFYLSFIAVAILLLINQCYPFKGFRKTLVMQLGCLFGLMPLTLFWFSYGAVNGLIANLVAIPWVGFVIVPLALVTTLLGYWFSLPWLFSILQHAITYLLYYLSWVDSFAILNLTHSFNQIISPMALMVAMGLMIMLPLRPLLPVLILLILVGSCPYRDKVLVGDVQVDILDVGQGLAVVVRTKNHVLIYDTGIQFYQGTDMGKLVIIPYLNSLRIEALDSVVISHPDLDHRGGLRSLQEHYKIHELIFDDPSFYKQGNTCHHHSDWAWDGVTFHFFSLTKMQKSKNNSSCVLQISNHYGQVLLTGDIEKSAENELVATYGSQLKSRFIVVPHHGSKTSSSSAFLSRVDAKYAIVSYGFDNRYHFPHKAAMSAYQQRNTIIYNTVDCGMTSLIMGKKSSSKPLCYRR